MARQQADECRGRAEKAEQALQLKAVEIEGLNGRIKELKDQLGASTAANEDLAKRLKQNEDALVHMQRHAGYQGRHFQSLGATQSADLYAQFSRSSTTGFTSTANSNPAPLSGSVLSRFPAASAASSGSPPEASTSHVNIVAPSPLIAPFPKQEAVQSAYFR